MADRFKLDALEFLVRNGAVASARSDVLHIKVKTVMFVDVARRVLRRGVQVVYGVGVKSRRLRAVEDV
ncbi:hypothetical protein RRF57_006063 [Xylaria bambusicola]|uniref:Uncharacterized protein n=1 Tax=Xylaria bambusicola TaxID=326684 RepID=A0AAN7UPR7_9PEZI